MGEINFDNLIYFLKLPELLGLNVIYSVTVGSSSRLLGRMLGLLMCFFVLVFF